MPKWSCDFEDGLCDWYKVDANGFGWEHSAGGPHKIKDHTKDSVSGKIASFASYFSYTGYLFIGYLLYIHIPIVAKYHFHISSVAEMR